MVMKFSSSVSSKPRQLLRYYPLDGTTKACSGHMKTQHYENSEPKFRSAAKGGGGGGEVWSGEACHFECDF